MTELIADGRVISLDHDGFLAEISDWSPEVASMLAQSQGIMLTEAHWEVILATRDFYRQYDMSPNQRPFVRYMAEVLGEEKGCSRYLMKLFPGSPAKLASMIAGIPKPDHCF